MGLVELSDPLQVVNLWDKIWLGLLHLMVDEETLGMQILNVGLGRKPHI